MTPQGLFFCPHVDKTSPSALSTCVSATHLKSTCVFIRPVHITHTPVTAVIYGLCARKQAWWAHYSSARASLAAVSETLLCWWQPKGWKCAEGSLQRGRPANSCSTSAQPVRLIEQDGGNRSSDFKSGHDVSGNTEFCSEWALPRAFLPPADAWPQRDLLTRPCGGNVLHRRKV